MKKLGSYPGRLIFLILASTSLVACGDDTAKAPGGQGGTSSTGGQDGVSSTGGQDGVSSGSGRGGVSSTGGSASKGGENTSGALVAAMSLKFLSGGKNCPLSPGYSDFPDVEGGHPVTASGATATTPAHAESSRGLVSVQCSLNSSNGGVSISLGGGAESMGFHARRSGALEGNLEYVPLDSETVYHGTSDAPCNIEALSVTDTGGLYAVSCPTFTGDDGSTCVLGESFVYFSGCTTP